jgi:transcription initiation factor TFIIIB Brf1 subunit/transcription initiation factor TFIIB
MVEHKYQNLGLTHVNLNGKAKNQTSKSQTFTELTCDICFSTDIVETKEGYVCKSCGIVLEIQKLEYYRPYNDDIIQHAVLGNTQIGFRRERLRNPNSMKLEKLNQLQSIRDNNQTVLDKARIEISRIFTILNLPDSHKELVFNKFKKIREGLNPGTKYRNPEKLVPIAIYFTLKLQNVSINEKELLEVAKISKKDFNTFKLQILKFVPQYAERNRKDYILQKILEISEHFELGMPFYYQSKKILYKLWESIKCTKDDVIAGLVSSISILCSFKEKVTVNAICKRLGIKMSTIQSQVKKRIFNQLNVTGFVSLVKSSKLLRKILSRMGLIEQIEVEPLNQPDLVPGCIEFPDLVDSNISPDIIQVEFGNAIKVFNSLDEIDYYFYALKDYNHNHYYITLKLYNPSENFTFKDLSQLSSSMPNEYSEDKLFEIELLKLSSGKDPP